MKSIVLVLALFPLLAGAAEDDFTVLIQDHRFQPETLTIPAGKKIRLVVDNRDAAPEEFDSHALNREKVIPANAKGTIYIGPLDPGSYPFIGEFHEATAKGMVIAR
jgi:plastocyanin